VHEDLVKNPYKVHLASEIRLKQRVSENLRLGKRITLHWKIVVFSQALPIDPIFLINEINSENSAPQRPAEQDHG
jgi:hypothetical protein